MQYDEEKHNNFPWLLPKASKKATLRPGQREPMGQRVARSASPGTDPGGGIYTDPHRPSECPKLPKKQKTPF